MNMGPIPTFGDKMMVKMFKDAVQCGGFVDSDGHGVMATENEMSNVEVLPSTISSVSKQHPEFTHVIWFNK